MSPDAPVPLPPEPDSETVTVAPGAAPAEALTLAPAPALADIGNAVTVAVPGYEILSELGRGGMGIVYQARQVAADRIVALKMILSGGHAGEAALARFRSEAQAVARLQHPGIVQVFEVGEYQGLPFFSLEFVDGGSLDRKLNGTPLPPAKAARLVERVSEAIHAAHGQHIVHRDLKPANILLTSDGQPKVTDFGLAKVLDVEQGHTATGAIMGTPSYMAPEQAGGKGKEVGPAADVYALGAVLYECLTGRPPFRAATPLDTILQVIADEPVPPRQLNAKVPRDLETICLKCLRKEPKKRYASARALADDLKRFRKGEPLRARPVGRAERAVKWVRRRPALAVLLAALLLATLGLVGGGVWFTLQLAQARQRAEDNAAAADAARQDALKQLDRAETSLYVNLLARADRETEAHDLPLANQFLEECRWDHRHWEWRHLRYRNHYTVPEQTFRLSMSFVTSVVFSPDGSRLACGGAGGRSGMVKVLDARTGAELLVLDGLFGSVNRVAFSPDGRRLARGSDDKTVRVWDARTGAELLTLKGHAGSVLDVAFSPDGHRLAAGSGTRHTGEVKVWDADTGAEVRSIRGHAGPVRGVAFSPDGRRLASASVDKTVKVWDAATGAPVYTLSGHTGIVFNAVFSPDGSRLASASQDGTVKVWDAGTKAERLSLKGTKGFVSRVAFSPDGNYLAGGFSDGVVKLWDARTGAQGPTINYAGSVTSVAFSPDGSRLAGAGSGGVKVWDARTGIAVSPLGGRTGSANVAFSPDGSRLASSDAGKTVKVWDTWTGVELLSLKGHRLPVASVAFSSDGSRLASAGHYTMPWRREPGGNFRGVDEVKIWDAHTGDLISSLRGVNVVVFSPDGSRLAGAGHDQTVKVWDARTGVELLSLKGHVDLVGSLAYSPDGRRLASATGVSFQPLFRGEVKVWDAATGAELLTLKGNGRPATGLAFSPDSSRLAGAGADKTVKIWDAVTGAELLVLKGHTFGATDVAFSPDGSRLVSGGLDRTVKVWDARTGVELLSLKGHTIPVSSVAFSPDGRRMVSAGGYRSGAGPNPGEPREVLVWDAGREEEVRPLRGHALRVRSVAFSDDGSRVIARAFHAAPGQPEVRAWNTTTGREIVPCTDPPPAVDTFTATHAGRQLRAWAEGDTVYLRSTKDESPAERARRQREEEWTTIRWHLQKAEQARDPFATRFHLHHALAGLRAQVLARLADGDAAGCRHACTILAAVAGRSDESVRQFQDVLSGRPNPAADELLLALAYHKRGRPAAARRWLHRAILSIERPGLRPAMGLLGVAGAGPLPALALLPGASLRPIVGPRVRELPSLRQEVETLLQAKP